MKTAWDNKRLVVDILLIFLITRGIIAGIYFIYCAVCNDTSGFESVFGRWDTVYYTDITENGYYVSGRADGKENWAFFPLFPLACRGLKMITGGALPAFWCGIVVSEICLFAASFFAVKLIRQKRMVNGERGCLFTGLAKNGLLIVWLLMLGPFTVYFSAAYTEGLFVMLLVLFFFLLEKEHFFAAGVAAAFAGATRSVGCVLVLPLIMGMYSSYKRQKSSRSIPGFVKHVFSSPGRLFGVLIVPAGIVCYMIYLHCLMGDALGFVHVQEAWRDGEFFPVLGVLGYHLVGMGTLRYTVSAWLCIAAFVMYAWMFMRGLKKEAVWGMASLLVPIASHVMSTPRFISGSFVIWMGLYLFIKSMKSSAAQIIFTAVLYAGGVITIAMWCAQARFLM